MDRKQFEMRYNFVPVFDTNRKKRISLAPHLAKDKVYMAKMGFVLIEAPVIPLPVSGDEVVMTTPPQNGMPSMDWDVKQTKDSVTISQHVDLVGLPTEKPKRGRPKKQS